MNFRPAVRVLSSTEMRLDSNIFVRRPPEEAYSFLEDFSNLPKWDRGVAAVRQTSAGPRAIGAEFDTLPRP